MLDWQASFVVFKIAYGKAKGEGTKSAITLGAARPTTDKLILPTLLPDRRLSPHPEYWV